MARRRTITVHKGIETGVERLSLEHPAKSAEQALQNGGLYQAAYTFNSLCMVSWCCNKSVMQRCTDASLTE
jgi:hypothetical protein